MTINKVCGSGLKAAMLGAQAIANGDSDIVVAGGQESMSLSPHAMMGSRDGFRMGDAKMVDTMIVDGLWDAFNQYHMGVTAENVAKKYGVSREDQDKLAVESHRRAAAAVEKGYFKEQVLPIEIRVKKEVKIADVDENVRGDSTVEKLATLRPVFDKEGTVTAGNASSINDAAAAVVLMDVEAAQQRGLRPLGRLTAYSYAGVDPKYMGMGPVPAVRSLLDRTGLGLKDFDLFEVNEAFAAQALAVCRELNLPTERTNPNGSGISLGHPIGATGCILAVKALYELKRTGGKRSLVTMCIGGGQGIAAVFERD
jgi:acetyl-CoA C-acetyltransferase